MHYLVMSLTPHLIIMFHDHMVVVILKNLMNHFIRFSISWESIMIFPMVFPYPAILSLKLFAINYLIIVAAKRFYLLYSKGLAIPFLRYLAGIKVPFKDEILSFVSLPTKAILSPSGYHLSTI